MYDFPHHIVEKRLITILKPPHWCLEKHIIKDVFQFVNKIKNVNTKGQTMISLGIASLITDVSLRETVECICEQR